jgi:NAD(P)-dependent dehydrogenase (short-subunit alcohol dehydrogenase family)
MSAQVAVVAGGGGELGRATAMALAAGGRSVVAVDRNERGLLGLPSGIRREVADTTDPLWQPSSSTGSPPRLGRLRCW